MYLTVWGIYLRGVESSTGWQSNPKYPKNRENTGFWHFILESGGRPTRFLSAGVRNPVSDAPGTIGRRGARSRARSVASPMSVDLI